jgi:hypothetical protein
MDSNGVALPPDAALDRPAWLELAKGASMTVKHAVTAREVTFVGPGRVLPCDRGEERFLVTGGSVRTVTWAGARPGAEVLIGTPLGAIRYGDAKLAIEVTPGGLKVASAGGDAWVEDAVGSGATEKVPGGAHHAWNRPSTGVDVKALVARCEGAAAEAETRAREVLAPNGSMPTLGARAAEHVRARQAARAACAVAAAAVGTMKSGPDRDAHGSAVAAAEQRWRAVPQMAHPFRRVESR